LEKIRSLQALTALVGFTPDPTAPDFVPFESLTEADVLAWVYESVDKDSVEESLASQIEDQKAPQTVAGSALVVITIDGVEYNPEDLSDEIKYMVAQVKDIDDKLGHLRFQVDQLSAAKIAFSDAIVKGVTDASQE
jgi:hypothetical protein